MLIFSSSTAVYIPTEGWFLIAIILTGIFALGFVCGLACHNKKG